MSTRQEHMDWCKERALQYANRGELRDALLSIISDLKKHRETEKHAGGLLTVILMAGGHLSTKHEVIEHINGFN